MKSSLFILTMYSSRHLQPLRLKETSKVERRHRDILSQDSSLFVAPRSSLTLGISHPPLGKHVGLELSHCQASLPIRDGPEALGSRSRLGGRVQSSQTPQGAEKTHLAHTGSPPCSQSRIPRATQGSTATHVSFPPSPTIFPHFQTL